MEELRDQITSVHSEIKRLSQRVETIAQKLALAPCHETHKDVLEDIQQPYLMLDSDRSEISMEWQVRRLTAQLTSAYSRIAALEDELMLRRHR